MSGVEIRVRADATQAQRALSKTEQSLKNLDARTERVTSTFKKLAIGISAALGAGVFVKKITAASDSVTIFNNKLATVTDNAKQQAAAFKELVNISKRTRTSMDGNVSSFQRFSLSLESLNKTTPEILRFTETFAKAGAVGGATAEEIKNSAIQLGQGLAAGALRGEELNSVLENNVVAARLIADEFGVAVGDLKAMAADGELTAEKIFDAFENGAEGVDKAFAKTKATTGELMVILKDSATLAISEIDKVVGVSDLVKRAIRGITSAFDYVYKNVQRWSLNVRIAIYLVKTEINSLYRNIVDTFNQSPDFGSFANSMKEGLLAGVEKAKESLKNVAKITVDFIEFKVKEYDLIKKMFPNGWAGIIKRLESFTKAVVKVFTDLRMAITGRSEWPSNFVMGHSESGPGTIGNTSDSGWAGGLVKAKEHISRWALQIQEIFSDLSFEIALAWLDMIEDIKTLGFVGTFDARVKNPMVASFKAGLATMVTAWDKFALSDKGQELNVLDSTEISEKWDKALKSMRKGYEAFIKGIKAIPAVNFAIFVLSGMAEELKVQYDLAIEDFDKFITGLEDWFAKNRDRLGAVISVGISAGLRVGFKKTAIWGVVALALGKGLTGTLNDPLFLESVKSVARGIALLIGDALSGDDGASLVEGFGKFLSAIGEGLLEGIFGGEFSTSFKAKMTGALGVGIGLIAVSGTLKKAIGKLGKRLVKNIIKGILATELVVGITAALTTAFSTLSTTVMAAIASPIVAIPAAIIAALAAMWYIQKNDLDELVETMASDLTAAFLGVFGVKSETAKAVGDVIGATLDYMLTPFKAIGILVDEIIKGGTFANALKRIGVALEEAWDGVKASLDNLFSLEGSFDIGGLTDWIAQLQKDFIAGFLKFFGVDSELATKIADIFVTIFNPVESFKAAIEIFETVGAAIKSAFEDIGKAISDALDYVQGFIDLFTGGVFAAVTAGIEAVANAWDKVTTAVTDAVDKVKEFFDNADGSSSANNDPTQGGTRKYNKDTGEFELIGGGGGFASGGYVSGPGSGTSDDIPAMLSNGEYVIKASAVRSLGIDRLNMLNRGELPRFNKGGPAGMTGAFNPVEDPLRNAVLYHHLNGNRKAFEKGKALEAERQALTRELAFTGKEQLSEQKKLTKSLENSGKNAKGSKPTKDGEKSNGSKLADAFSGQLKTAISDALMSGDIDEAFKAFADSFTSTVVNTFVDSMVDALLGDSIENLFSGLFDFKGKDGKGVDIVGKITEGSEGKGDSAIEKIFPSLFGGESGSGLFGKEGPFGKFFGEGGGMSKLFGGVFGKEGFFSNIFSGLFGGGGGGGGGFFGTLLSGIGGFFGMAQGGVVPSTSYSQVGKDSVPTMLMPGEQVLSKNDVRNMRSSNSDSNQSVYNINVSGDVSRQTRKEIVKMMPQITTGVNTQNKEAGRR